MDTKLTVCFYKSGLNFEGNYAAEAVIKGVHSRQFNSVKRTISEANKDIEFQVMEEFGEYFSFDIDKPDPIEIPFSLN